MFISNILIMKVKRERERQKERKILYCLIYNKFNTFQTAILEGNPLYKEKEYCTIYK